MLSRASLGRHTCVQAAVDEVAATPAEGETLLLHLENGLYYGLDPIAGFVWARLQEPVSVVDLKASVMRHYQVEEDRCEADLIELLNSLLQAQLVQVVDEPSE